MRLWRTHPQRWGHSSAVAGNPPRAKVLRLRTSGEGNIVFSSMADFEQSEHGGVTRLVVRGNLDAKSASELKPEVVKIGDSNAKKVLVDLDGLTLIDSSGVGVLISLFKRVRSGGGQVCFAGVKAQPKEVFRLLRLDRSLDICATVEDALKKLGAS